MERALFAWIDDLAALAFARYQAEHEDDQEASSPLRSVQH